MQWEESDTKVYSTFVVLLATFLLFCTLTVVSALPALVISMLTQLSFGTNSFWFITTLTMFVMMVAYVTYISRSTMKNSTDYKINPWGDSTTNSEIEEDVSTNN
jgi:hypothetical protein